MSTQSANFAYTPTSSGTYTWRFRRVHSGANAPASSYTLDNLKVSYIIPYTRTECPETDLAYRYGFNTQEKDDEVYGAGNLNTAEFWEYDTRIAKRWNLDPKPRIGISDYSVMDGNPILKNDPKGDCPPGIDCTEPLDDMKVRVNRSSNLGQGEMRNNSTKFHAGHDLQASVGDRVKTVMSGEVIAADYSPSYGNYVTIKHTVIKKVNNKDVVVATYYTFYAHLSKINVKVKQAVNKGDKIGEVGTTGNATGLKGDNVHLHFEIGTELRPNGKMIAKSGLLDANMGYKNIEFRSMDGSKKDQGMQGVTVIYKDDKGNATGVRFDNFKSPSESGRSSKKYTKDDVSLQF